MNLPPATMQVFADKELKLICLHCIKNDGESFYFGYTPKQIDYLIESLQNAQKYLRPLQ